jgi:hypothetical protein
MTTEVIDLEWLAINRSGESRMFDNRFAVLEARSVLGTDPKAW